MSYEGLDRQLKTFSDRLTEAVRLEASETGKVATLVAAEVRFLEPASRAEVHAAGPVPLRDRLGELQAFQAWMDLASSVRGTAAVTRAQVIVQNYVCFVYTWDVAGNTTSLVCTAGCGIATGCGGCVIVVAFARQKLRWQLERTLLGAR
jgi:hypothetical protein